MGEHEVPEDASVGEIEDLEATDAETEEITGGYKMETWS